MKVECTILNSIKVANKFRTFDLLLSRVVSILNIGEHQSMVQDVDGFFYTFPFYANYILLQYPVYNFISIRSSELISLDYSAEHDIKLFTSEDMLLTDGFRHPFSASFIRALITVRQEQKHLGNTDCKKCFKVECIIKRAIEKLEQQKAEKLNKKILLLG